MLNAAKNRLNDAGLDGLSKDSRFLLSYGAAHILSLAALRWYGYRSDSRYLVFQCLQHTVDFSTAQWRILDDCHRKRNLAEYEGNLDICNALLKELLEISEQLYKIVKNLGEKS